LEEVELDCARMTEEAVSRPQVGAEFKPKIPRQGLSNAQVQLGEAIAWGLHRKRLQWAEASDIPMGRMLSNAAMGSIGAKPPASVKELSRCEGVRGGFVREHGDETLALVAACVAQAAAGTLPQSTPSSERDPKGKKREERLKEFRALKATERKVTPSVILPNALIDDLAAQTISSVGELDRFTWLGAKRRRLYGEALVALLST
jgi:ribonuclease D